MDKKTAARAMAAPAPMKKPRKLVSTILKPKPASSSLSQSSGSKKRKALETTEDAMDVPDHDLDFISLLSSKGSATSKTGTTKTLQKSTLDTTTTTTTTTTITKSTSTKSKNGAVITKKPRTAPEVVVFDGSKIGGGGASSSTSSSSSSLDFNFKKFMSSKIDKLDEVPPPMQTPMTDQEKQEEIENKRNDVELHSLIKASRLLEQYTADQLDGADRRRHQREQLVKLGIQKKSGNKIPYKVGIGMKDKQRERDVKELEEAEKSRSDRGLKSSMGRFKGGMLTLTQKEIRTVQREGSKPKPGKKKGKGGRR
ncbi:hypothetical protein BGW38_003035 [Lunasporangiospora selenospora]|uniref:Uncharacterized protein n=1 Tax=Lunasporangiospora selenospora TaxID=979761 RepID=A0A9P6KD00_9FUNG|nr:hypothetical protein BGW38_003035 [Lunasporangiospora selenospora]